MYRGFCLLPGLTALLLALVLAPPEATAQQGGAPPLGRYVDDQGRPASHADHRGALDASGWALVTGDDGEPRLVRPASGGVPAPGFVPGDELWDDRFPYAGSAGLVRTAAVFDGDLYIGGDFSLVGGVPVRAIARWNGRGWYDVAGGLGTSGSVDPIVNALTVMGDSLIVGGFFTRAGGDTAVNLASWDGVSWGEVGGGVGDIVQTLVSVDTTLYVGGKFRTVGSTSAWRIAAWNGEAWRAFGVGLGQVTTEDVVFAIAVDGERICVGGDFLVSGDTPVNRVACWDGAAWQPLDEGVHGPVRALAFYDGDLHVGGRFETAGGIDALNIARWDGSAWFEVGGGTNGFVNSFLVEDGFLYTGGDFTSVGEEDLTHIVRWDGFAWSGIGGGVDGDVRAMARDGAGNIFVGGDFGVTGDGVAHRVARWDGQLWHQLGEGVEGVVRAAAAGRGGIYIGGEFSVAGGHIANGIAFWDGSSWHALGAGTGGPVYAIAVHDAFVYAGGSFFRAGDQEVSNIAVWDGGGWAPLGSGLSGPCRALVVDENGSLFAGGAFNSAGEVQVGRVGKWDGSEWSSIGSTLTHPYVVNALEFAEDGLVVAGRFNGIGGVACPNIMRWEGEDWHALGTGVNDEVLDVAVSGDNIYAVGRFTAAGGTFTPGMALWDGASWLTDIAAGNDAIPILSVDAMGDSVVIGGTFARMGDAFVNSVALWVGDRWQKMGAGVNGSAEVVLVVGRDVHVGGSFTLAGGLGSSNFGIWEAGVVPVDLLAFSAARSEGVVELSWEVAGESSDHAGFHVHREGSGGERVRLTDTMLQGARRYAFTDPAPPRGPAVYWLAELTRTGEITWYGPASVEAAATGATLTLAQNRPNPFRDGTRIPFRTAAPGRVALRIFDVAGRPVRTLHEGFLPGGEHLIGWDRRDDRGTPVRGGVYFYLLQAPEGMRTRKLVVLP